MVRRQISTKLKTALAATGAGALLITTPALVSADRSMKSQNHMRLNDSRTSSQVEMDGNSGQVSAKHSNGRWSWHGDWRWHWRHSCGPNQSQLIREARQFKRDMTNYIERLDNFYISLRAFASSNDITLDAELQANADDAQAVAHQALDDMNLPNRCHHGLKHQLKQDMAAIHEAANSYFQSLQDLVDFSLSAEVRAAQDS